MNLQKSQPSVASSLMRMKATNLINRNEHSEATS